VKNAGGGRLCRKAQPEADRKRALQRVGEGEEKRGRHGVQQNLSWSAGTRVEAGTVTEALTAV
jgi:hypothetical protein